MGDLVAAAGEAGFAGDDAGAVAGEAVELAGVTAVAGAVVGAVMPSG